MNTYVLYVLLHFEHNENYVLLHFEHNENYDLLHFEHNENYVLLHFEHNENYVLLHFEHKNDIAVIIKLHRATRLRLLAQYKSFTMIVTSFLCSKCNRT